MPPIQFATNAYKSKSLPLAAQQCINLYVEKAPPDAKSQAPLFGAPGLKTFAAGGTGSVRALRRLGNLVYAIIGPTLYSVDSAGTVTSLGSVSLLGSTGQVSMSDNGTQLIMVDGTVTFQDTYFLFTKSTTGYVYSVAGGLVQITDTDFGTTNASQFFISAANDGTVYSATDFVTAEGESDELLVILSLSREVWLIGERSIEVWYNSGDADFPFDRSSASFIERGTVARFSAVSDFHNTIVWLGDDLVVYQSRGYIPVRISTHAIEKAIADYATVSDAFAFHFTFEGHKFYVLTFPTEKATWIYDASTELWHERDSRDSDGTSLGRWRANAYVRAFGKHLIGDFTTEPDERFTSDANRRVDSSGNTRVASTSETSIGELTADTFDEYGKTLVGLAASPSYHYDRKRVFMPRFELDVESGVGLTSDQGSDPQVMLDWSDDGGFTFGPLQPWRGLGKKGERTARLIWRRMGQFRERLFRVQISDPIKRTILRAHADFRIGLH